MINIFIDSRLDYGLLPDGAQLSPELVLTRDS